jgi:hypothetical protein
MALKIQTRDVYAIMHREHPDFPQGLDSNLRMWAYNGLDSAVTLKVHHGLRPKVDKSPHATISYNFVRAMQGPALDMMRRGIAVNQKVRHDETVRYTKVRDNAAELLNQLADAIWGPEHYEVVTKTKELYTPLGKRGTPLSPRFRTVVVRVPATRPRGLNPNSPTQVLAFFNTALNCPVEWEVRKTPAGTIRTPTANNKALAKWAKLKTKGPGIDNRDRSQSYVHFAAPFIRLILAIRDADKMLGVLRSPLDADGRMRCSYNVVGTENGRWSSSENAFGRGTNLQNITPTMRRMFCADDGWRLISTDLEQAESRLVGALVWQATGNRDYLTACEGSDLHTLVSRLSWPELDWTNDHTANRAIADSAYPGLRGRFSYRDVAKRVGHGSNYRGSPFGIAAAVGIPVDVVADFQRRYFTAFPAIQEWHRHIAATVASCQYLDTPLGRRRWFFGRPDDDATIREAIAYIPQSTIGELLNLALLNCWKRGKLPLTNTDHLPIHILLQNHDAFAFQTPESTALPTLLAEVKRELEIPIPFIRGDEVEHLVIPGEFVTGWNWAYKDKGPDQALWDFEDGNPDGLTKWKGRDERVRQQGARATPSDWLDRPF